MSALLVLLCGRPFSGKSTVASRLQALAGCTVVSLDDINERRGLRSGSGLPIDEWERTHRLAIVEVQAALREGRCVVVDDTSSLRLLRDRWRAAAAEANARFRLAFVAADAQEREARRESARLSESRPHVDDGVLDSHLASFEDPFPDEHATTIHSEHDPRTWIEALELPTGSQSAE
jgi:predicted kinase